MALVGGGLWVVAAVLYPVAELVAAVAFPGYSYAQNWISDLGNPDERMLDGQLVSSPLAWAMNAGFMAQGVLYLAGAVLLSLAAVLKRVWLLVPVALVHAVGTFLVALFHGSNPTDTTTMAHGVGAMLAILAGIAAMIAMGLLFTDTAALPARMVSLLLGIASLAALAAVIATGNSDPFGFGPGGTERIPIYAMMLAEFVVGAALLLRARRAVPGG